MQALDQAMQALFAPFNALRKLVWRQRRQQIRRLFAGAGGKRGTVGTILFTAIRAWPACEPARGRRSISLAR